MEVHLTLAARDSLQLPTRMPGLAGGEDPLLPSDGDFVAQCGRERPTRAGATRN